MQLGPLMQPQVRHMLGPISRDWSLSHAAFNCDFDEQRSLTVSNADCQPGVSSMLASVSGLLATSCPLAGRAASWQAGRLAKSLDLLGSPRCTRRDTQQAWRPLVEDRQPERLSPSAIHARVSAPWPARDNAASGLRWRRRALRTPRPAWARGLASTRRAALLRNAPLRRPTGCIVSRQRPLALAARTATHCRGLARRLCLCRCGALPTPSREVQTALWCAGAAPHPGTP